MTSNGIAQVPEDWDVVIIGAGPAGMAAALYTGRAKLKTLLLDRAGLGGGQLMNTELIEDYPAIKSITGSAMADDMVEQIREFGVEITYGEVTAFEARGNRRIVKTEDGTEYVTKTVIVTTGGLPRKLDVTGEQEFAGRGVSYCAICDGAFFKNQVLAVIGGGDSAVEEGTFLTRYGEKVYIIHRRDEWRAQKLLQERALNNPKIEPIWNTVVEEIGGDGKVQWLRLRDVTTGEEQRVDVGGVFIYVGFMPNSQIFGHEYPKDAQGFVITDDKMETPVPGIYVAGDVRSQYVRQISNAVGDATTAAVAATRYIEELDATGDTEEAETAEKVPVEY
ncbi:MAG: thioredoxin-disulfide reductase [Chloroflexi bacterium]|nr:thioredoxin-disulfide reductase [Chloroflexota bacterium]MBV9895426.1 thioredoxin-disulfide reductase [Chloroflexota bacterium]